MNHLPFDKDHLMLVNGTQRVTGIKTFSNHSQLHIDKLKVAGLFNDVNITDFYNRQVRVVLPLKTGKNVLVSIQICTAIALPLFYLNLGVVMNN